MKALIGEAGPSQQAKKLEGASKLNKPTKCLDGILISTWFKYGGNLHGDMCTNSRSLRKLSLTFDTSHYTRHWARGIHPTAL